MRGSLTPCELPPLKKRKEKKSGVGGGGVAVELSAQLDPSGQAEHKRALPSHLAALPVHPSGSGAAGQQQRVVCVRVCLCLCGEGTLFESKRKHVLVHEYRRLDFFNISPCF